MDQDRVEDSAVRVQGRIAASLGGHDYERFVARRVVYPNQPRPPFPLQAIEICPIAVEVAVTGVRLDYE